MLFESFRGFGEVGELGMVWCVVPLEPCPFMSGDVGLTGLSGVSMFSLPPLDRMASDREDDLGIFRRDFRGGLRDWSRLSMAVA